VDRSPFPHHGPLPPHQVAGRDGLLDDLLGRLTDHRPTVLIGPRRYGKTSVIGKIASTLSETSTVIQVDLYELRSWADLAIRLDDALVHARSTGRRTLDRLAGSLELNLGLVKASLARPDRPAPDVTADRLLDLIVRLSQHEPTVLIIDEFSSVARVDGVTGLLRTRLQHHYDRIGLLFAGSEPSTMRMLFSREDQPFFGQADLVEIAPLATSAITELIEDGFNELSPAGLASAIAGFTAGHPQRVMQLADAAWRLRDEEPNDQLLWGRALETVRAATADGNEIRFSSMSTAEQATLRLIASDLPLFGRDASLLELGSSSAARSKTELLANGQVVERDGRLVIVDPIYADWIRRRFAL
jgi:uncharacterized protein